MRPTITMIPTHYKHERHSMNLLDLASLAGLNPKKVASTKGGEYHSACPSCGGRDRFILQPEKVMEIALDLIFAEDVITMAIQSNSVENFTV